MTDLFLDTSVAADARARLASAADVLTVDLRAARVDCGDPGVRDAMAEWVSWLAMTSAALAGRVAAAGRTAGEAAGLLTETDRDLGRRFTGSTVGVQVAR